MTAHSATSEARVTDEADPDVDALESEVRRLTRLNERLIAEREERLTEREASDLVESERSARSENAAKDTFIAMLSHELRTPLTPALAIASYFRDSHPSRDVRRAFGIVERSLLAEVRMIDDLLDVNRVVRGKMAVNCRPAPVHDIVSDAVGPLRPSASAKYQYLELDLRAERQHACVDALRLRQVIGNLVRNAIKFTAEEGKISVRSRNNGPMLLVEVEDDGIGIAPEEIHRLFVPFDQLAARPGTSGGLGLGLAISKGLLELQGGRLSAQSGGLGRGSRFTLELETVLAPELSEPRASDPLGSPQLVAPEGLRVLLIEDDLDSSDVIAEMLTNSGMRVQTAGSVHAARAADLTQVDLIVSDIGLPDGNGLELMRELQAGGHRPAIALTGFGRESDVLAAAEAGFDAHLTKPVDIHVLVEMIKKMARTRVH